MSNMVMWLFWHLKVEFKLGIPKFDPQMSITKLHKAETQKNNRKTEKHSIVKWCRASKKEFSIAQKQAQGNSNGSALLLCKYRHISLMKGFYKIYNSLWVFYVLEFVLKTIIYWEKRLFVSKFTATKVVGERISAYYDHQL